MDSLSLEILELIFSFLDLQSLGRASRVCRLWNRLSWSFVDASDDRRVGTQQLAYLVKKNPTHLLLNNDHEGLSRRSLMRLLENCRRLQVLDLSSRSINSHQCGGIADALPKATNLRRLVLANNQIKDAGAAAICTALPQCPSLEVLDISDNKLGEETAQALNKYLPHSKLRQLECHRSRWLRGEPIFELCNAIQNPKLTTLQSILLGMSGIGSEGAIALASALKSNNSLEYIDLHGNSITLKGVAALAEALQENSTIRGFVMDRNQIDDDGCKLLIGAAYRNPQLVLLSLGENYITEEGVEVINKTRFIAPRPTSLHVSLFRNLISADGQDYLLEMEQETCVTFDLAMNAARPRP